MSNHEPVRLILMLHNWVPLYDGVREREGGDRMVHVIWKGAKVERSRLNWVAFLSPEVIVMSELGLLPVANFEFITLLWTWSMLVSLGPVTEGSGDGAAQSWSYPY